MDGRVLMIVVHFTGKRGFQDGRHAIYAFRNAMGQVRYMDRTVGSHTSVAYGKMEELLKVYTNFSAITPVEAAVLDNLFAKTVGAGIEKFFIPILGVVAEEK